MLENNMEISFSAIKGRHGLGECYFVSIPFSQLRHLPVMKYPEDAPASEKAQRTLSKPHANALRDYLLKKIDSFVLPALIGSIVKDVDAEIGAEFTPIYDADENLGVLKLLPGSQILFNDGQHRHAAAMMATAQEANLESMTLSVVLIPDYSLEASQEIFYTIHSKQKAVSKNLQITFNGLEVESNFANALVLATPILRAYTEREKTSVSGKNTNLFTLTILRKLTILIRGDSTKNHEQDLEYCSSFFKELTNLIPHWSDVLLCKIDAKTIREHYVSTQGVVLEAFAQIAHEVKERFEGENLVDLETFLSPLLDVDWEKTNPEWEDRILTRSSKESKTVYKALSKKDNILLATAYLKVVLGMQLDMNEFDLEKTRNPAFQKTLDSRLLPKGLQLNLIDMLEEVEGVGSKGGEKILPPAPLLEVVQEVALDDILEVFQKATSDSLIETDADVELVQEVALDDIPEVVPTSRKPRTTRTSKKPTIPSATGNKRSTKVKVG